MNNNKKVHCDTNDLHKYLNNRQINKGDGERM